MLDFIGLRDLDGDAKPDLVLSKYGESRLYVFKNIASNASTNIFAPALAFSVPQYTDNGIIVDVNGDGKPDIVVADIVSGVVSVLRNQAATGSLTSLSFAPAVPIGTGQYPFVTAGDLDGDTLPELIVANYHTNSVSIYKNLSFDQSIAFSKEVNLVVGASPHSGTLVDIDRDGRLDLLVGTSSGVVVLTNCVVGGDIVHAFGLPIVVTANAQVSGIAVGDVDGDGLVDLILGSWSSGSITVVRNNTQPGRVTSASFASQLQLSAETGLLGVAVGDLNGDSRPDILTTPYSGNGLVCFQNLGGQAPVITGQPGSRTNISGTTASFTVIATGSTPLSYQWRRANTNLLDGWTISGATTAVLTISNVSAGDAAGYTVVVTNLAGATTSAPPAVLTVLNPPVVTVQPGSRANVAGSSLMFSVTATGTPPLSYQWRKDTQPIAAATNRTFVLAGVQLADAGTYSVVVSDVGGVTLSSNALLQVRPLVPPGVLAGPVTNSANGHLYWLLGQSTWVEAEAAAQALGGHLATLRSASEQEWVYTNFSYWGGVSRHLSIGLYDADPQLNATNLEARRAEFVWASGEPVSYTRWLADEPNNWLEMGEFWVHLIGPDYPAGAAYWNDVWDTAANQYLVMSPLHGVAEQVPPPGIVRHPEDQVVPAGGTAEFRVAAVGALPLSYQWYLGGQVLVGETNAVLVLTNVQPGDLRLGSYFMIVSNTAGMAGSRSAQLSVRAAVPVIGDIRVENGIFTFAVSGVSGRECQVEASTDLIHWNSVLTTNAPTPTIRFQEALPSQYRERFFRVLTRP